MSRRNAAGSRRGAAARAGLALAAALALPPAVPAQTPAPGLEWFATWRTRAESWDWFDAGDAGRYTFVGTFVRAGIAQQLGGIGWRVELMAPWLIGLPDDAVLPAPQGQLGHGGSYFAANDGSTSPFDAFPKQVYVRFGRPPGRDGHALRVGRFDFSDGGETVPRDPRWRSSSASASRSGSSARSPSRTSCGASTACSTPGSRADASSS